MSREILIPITFREFDGGKDAAIQEYWLEQLHKQTNQNFRLIVTNFREKNTEAALKKSGVKFEFIQSATDCKFSWVEAYLNARQYVEKSQSIILWITPDHLLESDFFETIQDQFVAGCSGTSFPQAYHRNLDHYDKGLLWDEYCKRHLKTYYQYDPNLFLPEVIFFDGDHFLNDQNYNLLKKYCFIGPGPGIAMFYYIAYLGSPRINIFYSSKVHKISNDEDIEHFSHNTEIWLKNEVVVDKYCKEKGIPKKFLKGTLTQSRKYVMHKEFRPAGSVLQNLQYSLFYFFWFLFPRGEFVLIKALKKGIKLLFSNRRVNNASF